MRQFLVKLFMVFVLIYSILHLVEFIIDSALDTDAVCDNTWNKIFNGKINSEIIIIGNSRAEAHYNTKIIEKLTGHSAYNLGVSGTPINILNIRWKSFINRNKLPKLVIIDVDNNILGSSNELYEKFQYLPYTNTIEYQEVVKDIDENYYYESIIPMYKYREYEMQIFNKLKAIDDTIDCNNIYKGFKPKDKLWDEENWTIFSERILKEKKKKNNFQKKYKKGFEELNKIVFFCKENNIKICFVWSPQYYKINNYKIEQRVYVDSIFSDMANHNKIVYINYLNDSLVYDETMFYDKSHLNLRGATMFSNKLGLYLNNTFFSN